MFTLIWVIHILLCTVLVFLVLLQQGKGADLGAAFGGGNNTIFGTGGANALFVKITTGVAIGFMITSILLVNSYFSHARESQGIATVDPLSGSLLPSAAPAPVPQAPAAPAAAANPAASEANTAEKAPQKSSADNVQKSSGVVEKSPAAPEKEPAAKK